MRILRRLRYWLRRQSHEVELAEELALHRDQLERDFLAQGLTPAAARDAARRAMGNETYMREEARGVWTWEWLATLAQDVRYGARALVRAPGFSIVAIGTLALGVGANSAMFGVVDALLFRPPPGVRDPANLVRVHVELPARGGEAPAMTDIVSYPDFVDLRDNARGFAGVAAFVRTTKAVGEGDAARSETGILASGDYFAVLGASPVVGRLLAPSDDREGAALPVAVLSWDYWRRAYARDPAVLGKTVRVGGQPYTIVGVAAKHFVGIDLGAPALWVPLGTAWQLGFNADMARARFNIWLSIVARVRPGLTREQVTDAARTALFVGRAGGGDVAPGKASAPSGAPRLQLSNLSNANRVGAGTRSDGTAGALPVSLWFLAITGVVLLIACANVANLLLARATQREHELAVRASLGATRGRLARQLLTESVLLALSGGLAGLVVALTGVALLPRAIPLPPLPPLLDLRLLSFTLVLAVATTMVFGIAPAVRGARADLLSTLNASARTVRARSAMRSLLVVVQLAASVLLLVSAALFLRSLRNVRAIDPGFAVGRLLEASGDTRAAPLTREMADDFWTRAVERIRKLPGVRAAALGAALPYEETYKTPVSVPGAGGGPLSAQPDFADAAYFSTLGIAIRKGRAFTDADQRFGSAPVVIINQVLSQQLFGGDSPIGRCIRAGSTGPNASCATVVGVAADAKYADVTRDPAAFYYRPMGQRSRGWGTVLHVRTDGDPAALAAVVRRELLGLDPSLVYVRVRPLTDLLAPQLVPWQTGTFIFALFGVLGLLLAAVGLYGVIGLLVAQRTHEMGVRVALGARPGDVVRLVIAQGARLVGAGMVVGLLSAAAASRVFATVMYGVSRVDPLAYVGTALVLTAVALVAVYIPARRATRADPMVALRAN